MQTVETLNEGLKRAYRITIPARDIDARVDGELKRMAPQIRMPGFRPGKVPANLVRKMHGPALEQQALESAVQDGVQKLLADNRLRPAMQPAVALEGEHAPGSDAVVTVELETLPEIPAPRIDGLTLERLRVEPEDTAVDESIQRIASGQKSYDPAPADHAAQTGDLVVMDFVGKVDGTPFEGGTGQGMSVELGSGRLIPGFEDQLTGVKANEERVLNVRFPDDYGVDTLKGKDATFEVVVNEVQTARETALDDTLAKSMGLESYDQLRGLVKGQIEQELNGLTRTHMKRKLLDQLAESHDFPVPPSMVEAEFGQIWQQLEHEAGHEADPAAARAEMESEREDYRRIAERRVRLGLLLSEIGQTASVAVSDQEMNQLIMQAAQQYRPADRERFVQYIRSEPMAAAQLRAPLFEDKVVDYLFSKAAISDRTVTRAELEHEIEAEEGHVHGPECAHGHGHDHDHDHAHDEPVKPAKAKKAKAAPAGDEAAAKPAKAPKSKAAAAPAEVEAAPADVEAAAAKPKKAKKAAGGEAVAAPVTTGDAPAAKPRKAPAKKAKSAE